MLRTAGLEKAARRTLTREGMELTEAREMVYVMVNGRGVKVDWNSDYKGGRGVV